MKMYQEIRLITCIGYNISWRIFFRSRPNIWVAIVVNGSCLLADERSISSTSHLCPLHVLYL